MMTLAANGLLNEFEKMMPKGMDEEQR